MWGGLGLRVRVTPLERRLRRRVPNLDAAGEATIGYADVTLVVAEGDSVDEMQEMVADAIRGLGFRLAVKKTQAVVFTKRYEAVDLLVLLEGRPSTRSIPEALGHCIRA